MLKQVTPFLVGGVVGAAAALAAMNAPGMISPLASNELPSDVSINPAPTPAAPPPEPPVSPPPLSSPKPLTERTQRVLNGLLEPLQDLESELYEEGVTTYGTVETVFDGAGFILRDEIGDEIFVQWTADPPEDGQDIVVKGILQSIAQGQADGASQQQNYPPRLEAFLRDNQTLVEAQEVQTKTR